MAGSILTQRMGKRVLVIERHFKLGGVNHAFTRKGFHWDVGLHYVGEMGAGMPLRRVMDLATRGAVAWRQLPPGYDQLGFRGENHWYFDSF